METNTMRYLIAVMSFAMIGPVHATWSPPGGDECVNHSCNEVDLRNRQVQGQGQAQGQGQGQSLNNSNRAYGGDASSRAYGGDADSRSRSNADANSRSGVYDSGNSSNRNTNVGIQGQNTDVDSRNRNNNSLSQESLSSASNEGNVLQGGEVDVGYDSTYVDSSDYLALALPGASADYGSTASCLESRRGWTVLGIGASGRTKTNEDCIADQSEKREHYQCMQIADRFVALGLVDHAVAQLQTCGGVNMPAPVVDYVTQDEVTETVNRVFEATQAK